MQRLRERALWLALGAVVAAYVATRLALVWRFPVFSDEAAYAGWAQRVHDSPADRFVSLANGKEPLLTWLGAVLISLHVGSVTALRLVSFAAGLVSLAMSLLLGRRLGGVWSAVAAGVTYTLLPLFVVHDVLGLMEPLVTSLALVTLYLVVRLADRPTLSLSLLLGLALGAGLLTKETAKLTVVLTATGLALLPWPRVPLRRLAAWVGCMLVALALAWTAYSVLKLSPLWYQQSQIRQQAVAVRGLGPALSHPLRWFGENWPSYRAALAGYLTIPVAVLAVAGLGFGVRARSRLAAVIALWALAELLADFLFATTGYPRYLLPAVAPTAILAGHGAAELARRAWRWGTANRYVLAIASGVLLVVVVQPLYLTGSVLAGPATATYPGLDDSQFVTGWTAGKAWADAASAIRRSAGGAPAIVELGDLASGVLTIDLGSSHNLSFVRFDDPHAPEARFAVENGVPLPANTGPGSLRLVWEEQRPRHGVPLRIFERGLVVRGTFVTTAGELRRLVARGNDSAFDAYTRRHPSVRAWYDWAASYAP